MKCKMLLLFLIMAIAALACGGSSRSPKPEIVELKASVRHQGGQFIVTNRDSFDWTNCRLEVNSQGLTSGYVYRAATLKAGQTYTVGARQFAKGDGTRFNPLTMKPLKFSIWCEMGDNNGGWSGDWD